MEKIIKYTFISLLVLNNFVNGEDFLDEIDISGERPIKIISETFMDTINQPEFGTLVMFYAPWCGHCKRMVNIWNQLSKKHNKQNKFLIARVDCTDQTELCSEHDVLAYPTFIFYKPDSRDGTSYHGERNLDSIEAFLLNQIQVPLPETSETSEDFPVYELDENNFESFVSKGFHFVKFFAPWCGHCKMMAPTWEELGKKYLNSNVKISKVDCTKYGIVCSSNNIKGYPTLLFFHNGKMVEAYSNKRTIEDFSTFIEDKIQQLESTEKESIDEHISYRGQVVELTDNNFKALIENENLFFVKFYAPWCGHCQSMAQEWINLAVKLADNKQILIGEVDCTQNSEICSNQNIQGYPTMILYKNGFKLTEYNGQRDVNAFVEFVNSYLQHEDL
ncbi:unnamed protein product [Brachionus calyciflorus]|uniref:Thioredoxin domain-containing protein n=1 Tax=Brachionus calyciflorus TaxID=104777 RepID=A0A814LT41_9BILA|nr:unnamed protein product [Brachionus calyciflorus]